MKWAGNVRRRPDWGTIPMPAYVEQGLNFIERCATQTAAESAEDFLAVIRRMGFSACACGGWVGVGQNRRNRFFFIDWPKDWLDFYETGGFAEHDFMPIEARRRVSAFWSGDIIDRLDLTEKQRQLHEAFVAYGWTNVFAVPIHGPGSLQGLVTMAARKEIRLSIVECAVLETMARTVWDHCRASEGFGMFEPSRVQLSPRELECLRWAATGKSDEDIAALVGIRPATAHFHIEQAKRRLGVKTRVEAVAVGVLNGVV